MDRRLFLGSMASLAASSLFGWGIFRYSNAAPARYVVAAAREYWYNNPIQDFKDLKIDIMHSLTGRAPDEPFPHGSLITVVDTKSPVVTRILVDVHVHSTITKENIIYCACSGGLFFSLDFDSFQLRRVARAPDGWIFGGHLSFVPGGNLIAASLVQGAMGVYDRVAFYDLSELKLVRQVSSFGFGAHELHATKSGRVLVGHYGSIPGSGAYKAFAGKAKYEDMSRASLAERRGSYPASVTEIDIATGALINRSSHIGHPQHSHFIVGISGDIFIPTSSIVMESRKDALSHRAFQEGARVGDDYKSFVPKRLSPDWISGGLSLARSEKYKQVIVAGRLEGKAYILSDGGSNKIEAIDLRAVDPLCGWINGVAIHPDNEHFLLSTNNGVMAFRFIDKQYSPELSVRVPLKVHSHFMVG